MADFIALCGTSWEETLFSGNTLINCISEPYQLVTKNTAISQPDFLDVDVPIAICDIDFSKITLGASQSLACPESDFHFIDRSVFVQQSSIGNTSGFISQYHFDQVWYLVFLIGLLVAFGLGAIKGGQR